MAPPVLARVPPLPMPASLTLLATMARPTTMPLISGPVLLSKAGAILCKLTLMVAVPAILPLLPLPLSGMTLPATALVAVPAPSAPNNLPTMTEIAPQKTSKPSSLPLTLPMPNLLSFAIVSCPLPPKNQVTTKPLLISWLLPPFKLPITKSHETKPAPQKSLFPSHFFPSYPFYLSSHRSNPPHRHSSPDRRPPPFSRRIPANYLKN